MRLFSRLFASDLEKRYRKIVADAVRHEAGDEHVPVSRSEAIGRIERSFEEDLLSADIKSALGELLSKEQAIAEDSDAVDYPVEPCVNAVELQQLAANGRLSAERMKHVDHCPLCAALRAKSNLVGPNLDDLVNRLASASALGAGTMPLVSPSVRGRGSSNERPARQLGDLDVDEPSQLEVLRLPRDRRDATRSPRRFAIAAASFAVPLFVVGAIFLSSRGQNLIQFAQVPAPALKNDSGQHEWNDGIAIFAWTPNASQSKPQEIVIAASKGEHLPFRFEWGSKESDSHVRDALTKFDTGKKLEITATPHVDQSGNKIYKVLRIDLQKSTPAQPAPDVNGVWNRDLANEHDYGQGDSTSSEKGFKTPYTVGPGGIVSFGLGSANSGIARKVKYKYSIDLLDPNKFVMSVKRQDPPAGHDSSELILPDSKFPLSAPKSDRMTIESISRASAGEKSVSDQPSQAGAPAPR